MVTLTTSYVGSGDNNMKHSDTGTIPESKTLSMRYINMDNRVYTDEPGLLEYARNFKGGMHRANTDFEKRCVVIGYGRKPFTHSELKALDDQLQRFNDDTVVSLHDDQTKED